MKGVMKNFISTGEIVNVELGFIPDLAIVINTNAVTTESFIILWHKDLNNEINITAAGEMTYVTSNTVTAYSDNAIDKGTSDDDDDPVRVTGAKGVTIAAAQSDDSDVMLVIGLLFDKDVDGGDSADW